MTRFPEIRIELKPTNEEAARVIGFKLNDEAGLDSKFGGEPDWIQEDEWPECGCGEQMSFYAQLDSVGDDMCLADCGIVYVFVCLECLETKSVFQSC